MSFETAVGKLRYLVDRWSFDVNAIYFNSLSYFKEIRAFMPVWEVLRLRLPTLQDQFAYHVGRISQRRMLFEKLLPLHEMPRSAYSLGYGGLWLLYARQARKLFEQRWVGAMMSAGAGFSNEHNISDTKDDRKQCRDEDGICKVTSELMSSQLWSEFYTSFQKECPKYEIPRMELIVALTKRLLDYHLFGCKKGE